MAMYLVIGAKGSGKTLSAVKYAHDAHVKGRTVYSNIRLNFPHVKLTRAMLTQILEQQCLTDAFVLLDELHTIADSRRSMTKRNIDWSYFFTQSRKRGVDIMATTQREMQVDVRYRLNSDTYIYCKKVQFSPRDFIIVETWVQAESGYSRVKVNRKPKDSFKLYDTNELVYYRWDA